MSEAEYEELDLYKVAVDIPKMKSTYFKLNEPAKVQIGLNLFQHGKSERNVMDSLKLLLQSFPYQIGVQCLI